MVAHLKVRLSNLNSSILFVLSEVHAVYSVGQSVALHPLVRVLSALSSNTSDAIDFLEIYLQPLFAVTMSHAPRPAMVQSTMPGCQVMVVI